MCKEGSLMDRGTPSEAYEGRNNQGLTYKIINRRVVLILR